MLRTNLQIATARVASILLFALAVMLTCPAQAQTYTVLHNFSGGSDGGRPYTGLTMDRAGNLYGTAAEGGLTDGCGGVGCGTVFRMTQKNGAWVFAPLYEFQGGNDGSQPTTAVTIGPDGAVYGTTPTGGGNGCAGGCGTIFKLTPSATVCHAALCGWNETVLYRFSPPPNGVSYPYGGVTFDAAGNLYGTAFHGGTGNCTDGCGVVYKLTPSGGSWTFSVIYSFTGGSDGANPVSTLITDRAGNLYGTAGFGGESGAGTVFELIRSGAGWTFNLLYAFQDRLDGGIPEAGSVMDSSGNLYGDNSNAGLYDGGVVFELSPSANGWTFSVLDTPMGGLFAPLSIDSSGDLYGTTETGGIYEMGLLFRLTFGSWAEIDLYSFSQNDGNIPLSNVVLDASGNAYGTTSQGGTGNAGVVWKFTR